MPVKVHSTGDMRPCRLVVMPEWQGAGVGLRFLNAICQRQIEGGNKWGRKVKSVLFHTSHPGLAFALRRMPAWRQVSSVLFGGSKGKSGASIRKSKDGKGSPVPGTGYGGHFRAVQGFRYVGAA